jgi:hypothetical protein
MSRRAQYPIVALLAIFPIGYGLFGLHLGQDIGFDTLNYHYFDPYWLLTNHLRDIAPGQEQTYLSPLLNVPTYLLQRALSGETASFVIGAVEGITIIPLYLVARAIAPSRTVALLLAVLGMFGAITWSEIGTSFGDNLVAIPLVTSIAMVARSRSGTDGDRSRGSWFLLAAGLVSGIGAGLKLAELPITLGFLVAIPVLDSSIRLRISATVKYLAGVVLGAGIAYGFWAYELASRFGNPFLPFFNNLFHSPFAPLAENNDRRFLPHNVIELVFYPIVWSFNFAHVNEVGFRELSLPLCEVLLLIAVVLRLYFFVRTRQWRPLFTTEFERFLVAGSSVSVLLWAEVFGVYRYLTAIEMLGFVLLWILTKSVVQVLVPVPLRRRVLASAIVLLCVVCIATEQPANFGRAGFSGKYFSAAIPKPLSRANNTVLMLSGDPYAYVVPFLPASTDVIRLQGNLVPTPHETELIVKRLEGASAIFITWMSVERRAVFLATNASAWTQYGLQLVPKSCSAFHTNRGASRSWIRFCRVAPKRT